MKKSFDYFKEALELKKIFQKILFNCCLAYVQKENFPVALDYFRKAIKSYKKEFKREGTIEFYSILGVAYICAQKNDSTSYSSTKAIELANETPVFEDDAERLM